MIKRFWQALHTWMVLSETFEASPLSERVELNPRRELLSEKLRPRAGRELREVRPGFWIRRNRYDASVLLSMPYEYGIVEWNFGGRELSVVDVGANIGSFGLYVASFARLRRYCGIEAAPANFEVLKRNVAGLGADCTAVQCVASDTEGEVVFDTRGNPSRLGRGTSGERLRALPLDGVDDVQRCGVIDILKIDVEGGEEGVLGGAAETLGRSRFVLMEIHRSQIGAEATLRVMETMARHGFSHLIFQRSPDGCQSNGIFWKTGGKRS